MDKYSGRNTICSTMKHIVDKITYKTGPIRRICGIKAQDNQCFLHSLRFICRIVDGFDFSDPSHWRVDKE